MIKSLFRKKLGNSYPLEYLHTIIRFLAFGGEYGYTLKEISKTVKMPKKIVKTILKFYIDEKYKGEFLCEKSLSKEYCLGMGGLYFLEDFSSQFLQEKIEEIKRT